MTITLKNTSGRCQTFVFTHEAYCKTCGECACATIPGRPPKRVPRSLTLGAGATSTALHEAILSVPEVSRAVKRGMLLAERAEPPAAVCTAPAEFASTETSVQDHTAPTVLEPATAVELESAAPVEFEPALVTEPESVGDGPKPSESHSKKKRGSP